MNIAKLLTFTALLLLMLFSIPAMAGIGRISINGTNSTNFNVSVSGVNHTPVLSSYTDSNHTLRINVTNASDTLYLQFWNLTAGRVYEWRGNNTVTALNAYRANSSGAVNITLVQDGTAGAGQNISYSLKPAVNVGGYNFTWSILGIQVREKMNMTTSRAVATVYKNDNQTPMLVSAIIDSNANVLTYAHSDSANPPTNVIWTFGDFNAATVHRKTAVFIVMPGDYYLITVSGGAQTVISWQEYI